MAKSDIFTIGNLLPNPFYAPFIVLGASKGKEGTKKRQIIDETT
jgi:hypothetical protein